MNINYKRDLNHNYMVISHGGTQDHMGYELKMLMENEVAGFLPLSIRHMDNECYMHYEISSKQPMERVFQHMEIGYEALRNFLFRFQQVLHRAEEYLIDFNRIMIDPSYIYMNVETQEISVCYYPYHENNAKESFQKLVEYILNRVNHDDEKAVMLAYRIYKNTRNMNFVLEEILNLSCTDLQEEEPSYTYIEGLENTNHGTNSSRNIYVDSALEEENQEVNQVESQSNSQDNNHEEGQKKNRFKNQNKDQDINQNRNQFNTFEKKIYGKRNMKKSRKWNKVAFGAFLGMVALIYAKAAEVLPESVTYQQFVLLLGVMGMIMAGAIVKIVINLAKNKLEQEEYEQEEWAQEEWAQEEWKQEEQELMEITQGGMTQNRDTYQWETVQKETISNNHRYDVKSVQDNMKDTESIKIYDFINSSASANSMVAEESLYDAYGTSSESGFLGNTMLMEDDERMEIRELVGRIRGKEKIYSLKQLPVTIGKKENCVDITIMDPSISRMHARIFEEGGNIYLEDLNSTNGTFKNGLRLEANETVEMEIDDEIAFGKIVFTYH